MKKVLKIVANKYLLTGAAFVIWMMYFDQNDWMTQQQHKKELKATKDNIAYLNAEIAGMQKEQVGLKTDPQQLEKYARENYRMKKDNEDVYVIEK
jgi:cell division protein FtsB